MNTRRDGSPLFVKSVEDTIIRKLWWYRAGGDVSEKQWRDVVEVLRVNHASLDDGYLESWARRTEVAELLARARREAVEP